MGKKVKSSGKPAAAARPSLPARLLRRLLTPAAPKGRPSRLWEKPLAKSIMAGFGMFALTLGLLFALRGKEFDPASLTWNRAVPAPALYMPRPGARCTPMELLAAEYFPRILTADGDARQKLISELHRRFPHSPVMKQFAAEYERSPEGKAEAENKIRAQADAKNQESLRRFNDAIKTADVKDRERKLRELSFDDSDGGRKAREYFAKASDPDKIAAPNVPDLTKLAEKGFMDAMALKSAAMPPADKPLPPLSLLAKDYPNGSREQKMAELIAKFPKTPGAGKAEGYLKGRWNQLKREHDAASKKKADFAAEFKKFRTSFTAAIGAGDFAKAGQALDALQKCETPEAKLAAKFFHKDLESFKGFTGTVYGYFDQNKEKTLALTFRDANGKERKDNVIIRRREGAVIVYSSRGSRAEISKRLPAEFAADDLLRIYSEKRPFSLPPADAVRWLVHFAQGDLARAGECLDKIKDGKHMALCKKLLEPEP